jgi:hypothetical protein
MKFILLFIFSFIFEASFAQVKLNESFEGTTFPPIGWTKKGGNSTNGETWARGLSSMYVQVGHSGQAGALSESWYWTGIVTPNNWLITPQIAIQTEDSIEFWVKPSSATNPAEHFEVKISTSNTDTAAFTSTFYSHTFTSAEATGFNRLAFSLSQFAGQNIYVAFIHNKCTGQDMLFLDDVKIWNSTNSGITHDNVGNVFVFNNNTLIIKNLEGLEELKIYDIAGKLILNNSINELKNTYNLSHLHKGIYFLNHGHTY